MGKDIKIKAGFFSICVQFSNILIKGALTFSNMFCLMGKDIKIKAGFFFSFASSSATF